MTDEETNAKDEKAKADRTGRRRRMRRRRRDRRRNQGRYRGRGFTMWTPVTFAFVTVLFAAGYMFFTQGRLTLPHFLRDRVEVLLASDLAGLQVDMDELHFTFSENGSPVAVIEGLKIIDQTNLTIAGFEYIDVALSLKNILTLGVKPTALRASGAAISLRREPDGRFDISLEGSSFSGSPGSISEIMDSVEEVLATPLLSELEVISMNDVLFQYEDVRAARYWVARGGSLLLRQDAEKVEANLRFELLYGQENTASASFSVTSFKSDSSGELSVRFQDMPASDFSTQAPSVSWLSVLRAPVSGAMRTQMSADGAVHRVDAALDIGEGVVQPLADVTPVPFNRGSAHFSYSPADQSMIFEELMLDSADLSFGAQGEAYLSDFENGFPQSLIGQFRFVDIEANPLAAFDVPVGFDGGALDMRLRFAPFVLDIGQVALFDQKVSFILDGQIRADSVGWSGFADLQTERVSPDILLRLWPNNYIPNTRNWFETKILKGAFTDVFASLRFASGTTPEVFISSAFQDLDMIYIDGMPPATKASGYATLQEGRLSGFVEAASIVAPNGEAVDVSGTMAEINDVNQFPATMHTELNATGSIPAMLSLLDEPPFELMQRVGQPTDISEGNAEVAAQIDVPLVQSIMMDDVSYTVTGTLLDVRTADLVTDHLITADALHLNADEDVLEISGQGKISDVPFDVLWHQPIGPTGAGSYIEGTVRLSQQFSDNLSIGLPAGTFTGAAVGNIRIELPVGEAPQFELRSDLNRLGIRVPQIGWRLAESQTGSLVVEGSLGEPAAIDAFSISAPGITADGSVSLNADNSFQQARFNRLSVGGWMDASVTVTSDNTYISGGTLRLPDFTPSGGSGGGLSVDVSRFYISDDTYLSNFSGEFVEGASLRGEFSGLLNGHAAINGTVAPSEHGVTVHARSSDGGGVVQAMGFIDNATGGEFEMSLVQRADGDSYDGYATIEGRTNVYDAPELASLLSAISVIGLLEQMGGEGLVFNNAHARFRMTPDQVIVQESSAVGPSMGISLNGYYNRNSETFDMQGVISPIYVVNGIGALISRRGEGLVGFNFDLDGPVADPKFSVNPLSVFTPGIFREIFRSPPPELTE